MSYKKLIIASFLILTGIILGAIGAHSLKSMGVKPELLDSFETGVRYQLFTGLALFALGLNCTRIPFKHKSFVWLNLIGVALFSGCIYLYTLHEFAPFLKSFVMVVPIGGVCMIIAWLIFMIQLIRHHKSPKSV